MRTLTKKGMEQCEASSAAYFKALPLRAILSSPARRASETAMRMMANYETEETKVESLYLRMVTSSHPAGMSQICEDLFDSMGYGPLRNFFAAEGGEEAFQAYGDTVCGEMSATLAGPGFTEAGGGEQERGREAREGREQHVPHPAAYPCTHVRSPLTTLPSSLRSSLQRALVLLCSVTLFSSTPLPSRLPRPRVHPKI